MPSVTPTRRQAPSSTTRRSASTSSQVATRKPQQRSGTSGKEAKQQLNNNKMPPIKNTKQRLSPIRKMSTEGRAHQEQAKRPLALPDPTITTSNGNDDMPLITSPLTDNEQSLMSSSTLATSMMTDRATSQLTTRSASPSSPLNQSPRKRGGVNSTSTTARSSNSPSPKVATPRESVRSSRTTTTSQTTRGRSSSKSTSNAKDGRSSSVASARGASSSRRGLERGGSTTRSGASTAREPSTSSRAPSRTLSPQGSSLKLPSIVKTQPRSPRGIPHNAPVSGGSMLLGGKVPKPPGGMNPQQRRASSRKLAARREEARNRNAAIVQKWWRATVLRRNFARIVHAAREWVIKEDKEQKERAARAKVILSGFFWKCHAQLLKRRLEAASRLRMRATAMVACQLRAKRSQYVVAALQKLRMAKAAITILFKWRASKCFAKVRWRRQNEAFVELLEDEESIERRDILRSEAQLRQDAFISMSNDPLIGSLANTERDFASRAAWIAIQEEDTHQQHMQEAMFGLPNAQSSVTTIKKQQLEVRAESLRLSLGNGLTAATAATRASTATAHPQQQGGARASTGGRLSEGSSLNPSSLGGASTVMGRHSLRAVARSYAVLGAARAPKKAKEIVAPLLRDKGYTDKGRLVSSELRNSNNDLYLQPKRFAARRHVDAADGAADDNETLHYKSGLSRTWVGPSWSDWFNLSDLTDTGVQAQEISEVEAQKSTVFAASFRFTGGASSSSMQFNLNGSSTSALASYPLQQNSSAAQQPDITMTTSQSFVRKPSSTFSHPTTASGGLSAKSKSVVAPSSLHGKKQQRKEEQAREAQDYLGQASINIDYELERTLIQEYCRRGRLEEQWFKLWQALRMEERSQKKEVIVASFIVGAGGTTLTRPMDDDIDEFAAS